MELDELADTEEGADILAGRNGPLSAQGKDHNKFNMGLFYTKFDQPIDQSISKPFSSRNTRKRSPGRDHPRVIQRRT